MPPYQCTTYGKLHAGPPLSYGQEAPAAWFALPENERAARCQLTSDQCIVDDKYFFVLGRIELPVSGTDQQISWLAWVSLSAANFSRASELWRRAGREREPPYFGWLASSLPYEPTTLELKVRVHTRPVGERPFVELEPTAHPLAIEQREGITFARVQAIAEHFAHGAP